MQNMKYALYSVISIFILVKGAEISRAGARLNVATDQKTSEPVFSSKVQLDAVRAAFSKPLLNSMNGKHNADFPDAGSCLLYQSTTELELGEIVSFHTPGFHEIRRYHNSWKCSWKFEAPENTNIKLHCNHVYLHPFEYLFIQDVGVKGWFRVGHGHELNYVFSTNEAVVGLATDFIHFGAKGFACTVEVIDGPDATTTTVEPEVTSTATTETGEPDSTTSTSTTETGEPDSTTPTSTTETGEPESTTHISTTETGEPESTTPTSTTETGEQESNTPTSTTETGEPESTTPMSTETGEPDSTTPISTTETGEPDSTTPISTTETGEPDSTTPISTTETGEPDSTTPISTTETGEPDSTTPTSTAEPDSTTPASTTIEPEVTTAASRGCSCGIKKDLRIVGGAPAVQRHPWMVAVTPKWSSFVFCGASLLSDSLVLTAAHCVDGRPAGQLALEFGQYDQASEAPLRLDVLEVMVHEHYNDKTFENDLALLKINSLVFSELDESIRPVCLPTQANSYEGVTATVTGWGKLSSGGPASDILMEITVPVLSNENCNKLYSGNPIYPGMLCAGHLEGGIDACNGDSGGPMTISENERSTLIGMVSWGTGCAKPRSPAVYTRITEYFQWIMNHGFIAFCSSKSV